MLVSIIIIKLIINLVS